ncbi:peptide chain release factor N(5)-glutamine methyltransferase [Coralliovum pocilloporae]|uniref:peptide chain release factor N(5)-glutamine methyltransferase n=1 Tax=Coralliovum pocilloporae TaxID=3066369 RepID=UPI003306D1EB
MTVIPNEVFTPDVTREQAVRLFRDHLRAAGLDNPALDARHLCLAAFQTESAGLITSGHLALSGEECALLNEWLVRRVAQEPVGRILGRRDFWGLSFRLGPETLEPRPDTEVLVETVLNWIDHNGGRSQALRLVDVGTGTGCIAIALLHELPNATCVALDISLDALRVARSNAENLGVGARFFPVCGSYLDVIGACDLLVSNPPYIATPVIKTLSEEVRCHDPMRALDGGLSGLIAYETMMLMVAHNKPSGLRAGFFEIGYDQGRAVAEIVRETSGREPHLVRDLEQQDRVIWFEV